MFNDCKNRQLFAMATMKIFLSYGHDTNKPLVDRIRADLEAAGHAVWIDETEIKAGDHWRAAILNGVLESHWTLGFLSRHSVRNPGVCLDELGIAFRHKGNAVTTILIEAEGEVKPPVSVSHLQWLDMSDWSKHGKLGEPDWEAWYRPKLQTILDLLANPATQKFAGDIADLERWLGPASQSAEIERLVGGFQGRQWLMDRVDAWRNGDKEQRAFCITGDPGSGKSAFAAWMAHHGGDRVIGINLCDFYGEERRDTRRILRTLAFQMATRLPDYRAVLLRLCRGDADRTELARKNASDLFDWLVADPLRVLIDGGRTTDRVIVVIDALDETIRDGRSELAELLAHRAHKLPAWVGLLVTSRAEAPILSQFAGMPQCAIVRSAPENRADLRRYIEAWLATPDPGLVERMLEAANGSFQYLRVLRNAVEQGLWKLDGPDGLPPGLVGLYERWFRRQFLDPATYKRDILPALEVIVAAGNPVPEAVLEKICGWTSIRDKARVLNALGGLFERRPEGVAPFHKSIRDWLIDDKAAHDDFLADVKRGSARLLEALWDELVARAKQTPYTEPGPFFLLELPVQMERRDGTVLREQIAAADSSAIFGFMWDVAEGLETRFAWQPALSWWRMLARMAGAIAANEWRAPALSRQGNVLQTVGDTGTALEAYRAGLDIHRRLADQDQGNAGWQRDLSVSHDRIGDVLVAQGNLTAGLEAYHAGLDIAQRLADRDGGNAGWQRDLSVSHGRIGDVLVAQGNLPAALEAYRAGLDIRQRLVDQDPDHAGWQRDLSVSHGKIGDVLVAQGNLTAGLEAYRASLDIPRRLADQDPVNAGWQREFAEALDRIGNIFAALGDQRQALKAKRESSVIRDRFAKAETKSASPAQD